MQRMPFQISTFSSVSHRGAKASLEEIPKDFLPWATQLVFLGLHLNTEMWLKPPERQFPRFQLESQNYKKIRVGITKKFVICKEKKFVICNLKFVKSEARVSHQGMVASLRCALSCSPASQTQPAQSETLFLPRTSKGSTGLAPHHISGFTAVPVFTTELKSG